MMPFERYLQDDLPADPADSRPDPPSFAPVQFRIPQYLLDGPPTLAQGGGAEVLPASLFGAASWFSNSGFQFPHDSFFPSSSGQFDYLSESTYQQQLHTSIDPPPFPAAPLVAPAYSTTGFDLLSLLARVTSRPYPTVSLGPVDMSCSFIVVDVRRYDNPVVYASDTFCRLTGYAEHEILGKNCRFLQSPSGSIQRGEPRHYTSHEAAHHLRKSLSADKECQATILNYKKDGTPFLNLVTVIPLPGGVNNHPDEANDVVYHVGFQVNLTEQPHAILHRASDGSYITNARVSQSATTLSARDRKHSTAPPNVMSNDLRTLLFDPAFQKSIPLSNSTTIPPSNEKVEPYDGNQLLNLMLLESLPDFVHVLSLKGSFLYVAPSVRRVLGYESDELVGKSIADYCHPADVVPLIRELKESSASPTIAAHDPPRHPNIPIAPAGPPKTVDLLFRLQSKNKGYVWLECRGRLHVEPGKGRKAIILSGRSRRMPTLTWGAIAQAGGLTTPMFGVDGSRLELEFWGTLSPGGVFLAASVGVRDVLGWGPSELIGTALKTLVNDEGSQCALGQEMLRVVVQGSSPSQPMPCQLRTKNSAAVHACVVLYSSPHSAPLICQIRTADSHSLPAPLTHPLQANVFEELGTQQGSSWQYELQQARFANQRLQEELKALEGPVLPVPQYQAGLKRSWDAAHDSGPL